MQKAAILMRNFCISLACSSKMAALNDFGVIGTIGDDDTVPDLDDEPESEEEVNGISRDCYDF